MLEGIDLYSSRMKYYFAVDEIERIPSCMSSLCCSSIGLYKTLVDSSVSVDEYNSMANYNRNILMKGINLYESN